MFKNNSFSYPDFKDIPLLNGKEIESGFSENAKKIWFSRYAINRKYDGVIKKEQTISEIIRRVSRVIASAETNYSDDVEHVKKLEKNIFNDISRRRFIFNSPCIFNAGRQIALSDLSHILYQEIEKMSIDNYKDIHNFKSKRHQLFACFVIDIEDSLEGIFDTAKEAAIISKYGGGVGLSFDKLRPKGSLIDGGSGGASSGACSFIRVINNVGEVVVQGGERRAAFMGMLSVDHPEIEDFINLKLQDGKMSYFNTSVKLTDQFMNRVLDGDKRPFLNKDGKEIDHKKLWDKIAINAWSNGDPGVFFIDRANYDNILKRSDDFIIDSTNPCFTGDTLIAVADGRGFVTFEQLKEEGKDVPVYCTDKNNNTQISIMRNPRITGYDKDIYRVHLDDGSYFDCTDNHEVLTKDDGFKEIKELEEGESLWINVKRLDDKGYLRFKEFKGSPRILEHRAIFSHNNKDINIKGKIIHHIDENRLNNSLDNLTIVESSGQHMAKYHQDKNLFNDKEFQKAMREEYHIGATRSEETKKKIGESTRIKFENEEFREKHSKAVKEAMNKEDVKEKLKQGIINSKLSNLDSRLKEAQSKTELECFSDEKGTIFVKKLCEYCKEEMILEFGKREQGFCNLQCRSKKHSENLKGKSLSKERKDLIEQKKEIVRNEQIKVYNNLKFELKKDPLKKEWIEKCKEEGISFEISRKSSPFRSYNDLKEASSMYNHKVVKIEYIGKQNVYNGTVDKHHTYLVKPLNQKDETKHFLISSLNCGEEPLPSYSACNLGSINLEAFVVKQFDIIGFSEQILRSLYYLDLVIDATSYPLEKIEERTNSIRPVGLGLMGLADMMLMMGIKYGDKTFESLCNTIAMTMGGVSLLGSISLADKKSPFPVSHLVKELFEDIDVDKDMDEELFNSFLKSSIPYTLTNSISSLPMVLSLLLPIKDNEEKTKLINVIIKDVLKNLKEGKLRNSRRLTVAPTGSTSILLDTSSGIEPNFAYRWERLVTDPSQPNNKIKMEFRHKLATQDELPDYFVTAHDVSIDEHINVVSIFSKYIDAAISKTINLPNSATIEDVKDVYFKVYKNGIKGITIYRDGSRSEQPLVRTDKKDETKHSIKVETRPVLLKGNTVKGVSPLGSTYLTMNYNNGKPFEMFINLGKSGSILKSWAEALARVSSIALRSNSNIFDIINTLRGIKDGEDFIYDTFDGQEVVSGSTIDMLSYMIEDSLKMLNPDGKSKIEIGIKNEINEVTNNSKKCPSCGLESYELIGSCHLCYSCGYSPCR